MTENLIKWQAARIVELEQQIAALESAAKATVPEGWKLVPVEPTMDMVVDGFESWPSRMFSEPEAWAAYEAMSGCQQAAHRARLCYAAMLAAAPAATDNGGGRDAWDARRYRFARDNIMEGYELPGGFSLSDHPGADWDKTIDAALSQKAGE